MPHPIPVIEEALDAARAVLLGRYRAIPGVERKSSDLDLVTVADRESEEAIKRVLAARLPSYAVLAEESATAREPARGFRFLVDPLDGTTNFAHGMPLFAISIALEHDGVVVAAGIENPVYRERFLAERGAGATLNGERLAVSKAEALGESLLVTGFPYDRRERMAHYLGHVGAFLMQAHGVLRLGSAALDLCAVAAGRLDGFWEEHLAPWDTAAGLLMVEEAGGRVTTFDGGAYTPFAPSILATNGAIHDACVRVLAG